MRIRPWLKTLLIVNAITFVLGEAAVINYSISTGEWWPPFALLGAALIMLLAAAGYILWDSRPR